ncbi:MAG: hypothetical protein HWD61_10690 [Parachlamydiaceae bacterium]|nr:MAG: hypothetical protein HWD61_10690 [Parachlamydiaceae bacterium]
MQLYSYKDPLSMEKITRDELDHPNKEGVFLHGESPCETWIRKAPRHLDDPDQCGLFSTIY